MKGKNPEGPSRFRPLAGLNLVFEPGSAQLDRTKKNPCSDCHFCQHCSDARCHSCRGEKNRLCNAPVRKLSLREQIRLYEEKNAEAR